MDNELFRILSDVPILGSADRALLEKALTDHPNIKEYKTGQTISPKLDDDGADSEKQLAVMLRGRARVLSSLDGSNAVLRDLTSGDIFGVADLFLGGNGEAAREISHIVARSCCRVLFVPESAVRLLLREDENVMHAYIRFLGMRIRFLNRRIACFTAGSAERRLALWLDSLAEDGECSAVCDTPLGTLADMLDIGRASLYRAIDSLESDGFVRRDGKKFVLIDRNGMVEKYNLQIGEKKE